ncbi:predicted protein [Naegleria gruberi]|uniref:Predicted protein n=1 Tax=Naegleria gruberi TaxID=5762 RepID=D2VW20_NAEGR|nr:uncharacterized protein NAEGRDRAFT_73219 [Naegleria gruberi]EFC38938.1 predicted protein [Naegleria gruberi]|eukprot:XP_002671682.1 predicted protein [Naegleria gruberi strain NEG-M]
MFDKPTHTISLIGQTGSGKSTLLGQLLYQMGYILDEQLEEISKTADKLGKPNCKYSFLVNSTRKERECASTSQLSFRQVETKNYFCNLIDTPEQVFVKTVSELSKILKRTGSSSVDIIPISAYCGDNIVELSDKTPWYEGKCLLDALNSLKPTVNNLELSLRIPILDVKKISGVGTVVYGKVVAGILKMESKIVLANSNIENARIASIESFGKRLEEAKSGQLVAINLRNVLHSSIKSGDVILEEGKSTGMVTRFFEANILNIDHPKGIHPNYQPTIQLQATQAKCKLVTIKESSCHRILKEYFPPFIKRNYLGVVECELDKACYLDTDAFCRFFIRDFRKVIGFGAITRVGVEQNFAFTFGFAAQVRAFGLNKDFIDTQIIYVDFEAGMMRIDAEISFAPITDIPVSVITKSSGHGTDYVIEEFFNWNHGSKAIPINRYAIKKQ